MEDIKNELKTDSFDKRNKYFMVDNILHDKQHFLKDSITGKERPLNAYELIILNYLFRCTNNKKSAFPSYKTIARCCGMGKSTAVKSIKNLSENGYITKTTRGYNKEDEAYIKSFSNVYVLNVKKLYE